MIKLITLGSPNLLDADGHAIDAILAQPKRLALLTYLAVEKPGGFHKRDDITAMFWPATSLANARNSLSRSLNFLRNKLGEGVIRTRGRTEVGIEGSLLWCDAVGGDGRRMSAGEFMEGFRLEGHREVMLWIEKRRTALERKRPPSSAEQAQDHAPTFGRAIRDLNGTFVGRDDELAAIARLLRRDARVITISGAGGMGKTRLAEEVVERNRSAFAGGAVIVSLASLSGAASPVLDIARAADCQVSPSDDPQARLLQFLRDKEMILVLDNVEQLWSVESLIMAMLREAAQLRIVLTSRRPLDMKLEHVVRLNGLPVPPEGYDGDLSAYGASELFNIIAQQSGYSGAGAREERDAIVGICRFLGGMPLGIEIAASWSRTLGAVHVREALISDPTSLAGPGAHVAQRHRSLRTLMESSWDILTRPQQVAMARLSIMRTPADVRTCVRVGRTDLLTIRALTDHALLLRTGDNRLAMHDMVREFLGAKLASLPDEKEDAHRQYAHHLASLFPHNESVFTADDTASALAHLDAYWDDVREACMFAARTDEISVLSNVLPTICDYFEIRSRFRVAHETFSQILEIIRANATCTALLPYVRTRVAYFDLRLGNIDDASAILRAELEDARERSDKSEVAYCSLRVGLSFGMKKEFAEAASYYRYSFKLYSEMYDQAGTARAICALAANLLEGGDTISAEMYFQRALSIWEATGDQRGVAIVVCNLAIIASETHRPAQAIEMYSKAADCFRRLGDWRMLSIVLTNWGRMCALEDNPADATPLLQEARSIVEHQGLPPTHILINTAAQQLAMGTARLSDARGDSSSMKVEIGTASTHFDGNRPTIEHTTEQYAH